MSIGLVNSAVALQASTTQQQIGIAVLKQNIDSQASVLQLLQPAQPPAPAANNAPGVGARLDVSA
ncbi:MAG: putative motility protein [Xanthobacteraceae bacterium]|nr:putative motility protein [Xanthobacteraceae bacterium]